LGLILQLSASFPLSQYADALDACGDDRRLSFLRAYSLYRLDRLPEALAALDADADGGAGAGAAALHLRAQVLYRLGRYAECVPLYERELARLRAEDDSGGGGADEAGENTEVWDAQLNLAACLVSAGQGERLLRHAELAGVVAAVLAGRVV
jgi:tetratricopeptide (TPR) repeat protein